MLHTIDNSLATLYVSKYGRLPTGKELSLYHVSSNKKMASEFDFDFDEPV